MTYEWPIHRRIGLHAALGYRYRNLSALSNTLSGTGFGSDYRFKPMFNPHYQAIKLAFGPVFYLNDSKSFFVQTEYFFRHWWVDNERIQFDPERGDNFDAFRTERVNVYGLKVLAGASGYIANSSTRTPITFSAYVGIGFRAKTYWYESHNGTVNNVPIDYLLEQGHVFLPTLHAGLLLGVGFAK